MINEVASFVIALHRYTFLPLLFALHLWLQFSFCTEFAHWLGLGGGRRKGITAEDWSSLAFDWLVSQIRASDWPEQTRGWSSIEVMPRMRRDWLQTRASCSYCAPVRGCRG